MLRAHSAAFSAPRAKIMRSSALCVSSMRSAGPGEDHAVLADDGAAAQSGKADIAGLARAGVAVAALAPNACRARCRGRPRPPRRASARCPTARRSFDCDASPEFRCRSSGRATCATRLISAASRLTPRLILPDLTITARLAALLIMASSAARQAGGADDVHLAGLGRDRGIGDAWRPAR